MVSRENKNNTYAKFWRASKEYYGIFESGLFWTPSGRSASADSTFPRYPKDHRCRAYLQNCFSTGKENQSISTVQIWLHRRSGEGRLVRSWCDFVECLSDFRRRMICIKCNLKRTQSRFNVQRNVTLANKPTTIFSNTFERAFLSASSSSSSSSMRACKKKKKSLKSQNFTGLFRVPKFPLLYLRDPEVLSLQTSH